MQIALHDFRASLVRIRAVADDITHEAAEALGNHSILQRHETIQFASTVMLSGYFESFLRDLARAFVRELCTLGVPFNTLPKSVRESHYEHGGYVLASVAKSEKKGMRPRYATTSMDVAERLHSVSHSMPYNLVWEAFADTGANPGPDVVHQYLKKMGVRDVWPALERKTTTSAPHRTATWVRAQLTSLMDVRNECAHTGSARIQVLPSSLRDYCDVLEALAEALVGVLEDQRVDIGSV